MVRLWPQNLAVLATALLVVGCGSAPTSAHPAGPSSAAVAGSSPAAPAGPPSAAPSAASAAAIWLDSLQMTSASTGWALRWTQNPTVADDGYLAPARTADGARTWTSVTPPAARALLATPDAQAVLQALDGERAWLAVTPATTDSSPVYLTEVFATADGGRTWTESAPLKVSAPASLLSFAGPEDGWLLANYGGSMNQDPVQLYRTTDGGLRWSLIAQTLPGPYGGTSSSGLPVSCDKVGLVFATASAGWLSGSCFLLRDALLVSRDGGAYWASQGLPVPASSCLPDGCEVFGPQFIGRTGFLVIVRAPAAPYFLVSHDLGATWQTEPLPPGAGKDPQIQFFSPLAGVLVSAGPQGVIGPVFYTTADGGRTWTAVRQGRSFTQLGTSFDFVSPQTGFAWALGTDATGSAPVMYQTTDSGRTWVTFTPRLAADGPA
jgi:photosystem II stability/assembly factor-like uncharacterized protein